MNWAMLTAIGQLAAVFIGVPSIIYFAIQLREQNRERRQAAVNALTQQWGDLTRALHENAEFTALFLRGVHCFHDLDAVSKLRFSAFQKQILQELRGNVLLPARRYYLTPELWGEIDRTMSDFLAYDGVQAMVGDAKALAHRIVYSCRRRDYRQGPQAHGLFDL